MLPRAQTLAYRGVGLVLNIRGCQKQPLSDIVPSVTEIDADRYHHPYGGSQLQSLEACPHFASRSSQHARTIAGTLGHKVVETKTDDLRLSDEDAAAAAECLDFIEKRRTYLAEVNPNCLMEELQEVYLPIDECKFADCEATSAGWIDHAIVLHQGDKAVYAEIYDWKFGMWPVEEAGNNLQGFAYALGLFRKYPTLPGVHFFFRQPLIGYFTDRLVLRSEIEKLYLRIQVVVARAREARKRADFSLANPLTPICNFCANLGICPKVQSIALNIGKKYDPLTFPESITVSEVMAPDQVALALNLAGTVASWAKAFRQVQHDRVIRGDAILPDRYMVQYRDSARTIADKEKFKAIAAQHGITPDDLQRVADYGFGAVEAIVSEKAPRGSKSAAIDAFKQALLESGAVQPGEPFSYLRVKTAEKPKTETN